MKNLVQNIIKLKQEIDKLQREKNGISNLIKAKKERLESLEILTVNQIDMFDEEEG